MDEKSIVVVELEDILTFGEKYYIINYQLNIKDEYYLINYDNFNLYFMNIKSKELIIELTYLHNYKIILNNKNLTKKIFDNMFNNLLQTTIDLIYEYQLKDIHSINLNEIFYNLITRYKIILEYLKNVYFKADFQIKIDKNKNYILK